MQMSDEFTTNLFPALFFLVFGFVLIVLREPFARSASYWQARFIKMKFKEIGYKIAFLITGFLFIGIAAMVLLGVIRFH
jgi:hypothetical protein